MSRVRLSVQPLKGPTTEKVAARFENALAAALYQTGTQVLRAAMKLAPVEYGVLRRSGYVAPPVAGLVGPVVEVGFGTKYAPYVHEKLPPGGGKKTGGGQFLAIPFAEPQADGGKRIAELARKLYKRGVGASIIGGGGDGGGFPASPSSPETYDQERKAKAAQSRGKKRSKRRGRR